VKRPPPIETARAGYALPGSVGTGPAILAAVAALVFVGTVLGRGLAPSTSTDLVAVQGRASGTQSAGEGLIGALGAALRAIGLAQPEVDPVPTPTGIVVAIAWDAVAEDDPTPVPAIVIAEPTAATVAEEPPAGRALPLDVALELPESLAFASIAEDDEADDAVEAPVLSQETAAPSAETSPEPEPPTSPQPPRAVVPPPSVAAPPAVAQPTRRPTRTSTPPAATRTPRASATPNPSVTPYPTAVPRPPTRTRTAVPTARPQIERDGSRSRDRHGDD
jgi:outer membrane biosynthesis protein TonB